MFGYRSKTKLLSMIAERDARIIELGLQVEAFSVLTGDLTFKLDGIMGRSANRLVENVEILKIKITRARAAIIAGRIDRNTHDPMID